MKKQKKGIKRIVGAFTYSLAGIRFAWKNEAAFRQEVVLSIPLILIALIIGDSGAERGLLIMCCFIVLIAELLNSAIEATIDRIGVDKHPLSGAAKDIGSATVFLSLVMMGIVWLLVIFT